MTGCLRSVWRRGRGAATPPAIVAKWRHTMALAAAQAAADEAILVERTGR